MRLHGLIAAPYTPMNEDGSINLDAVEPYADLLARNGVAGVFVSGTTGESLSLSMRERMDLATAWARASGGRLKVVVHVGGENLQECQQMARHAQEAGADAVAAMPPVFFKPAGLSGLAHWIAEVAGAVPDLPFYYYHIPSRTGVNVEVRDLLAAAGETIPNLAGAKFTFENLMDFHLCVRADGGRYDMLFGRDEILLAGLALGARGAVGTTYNFAAPLYRQIIEAFEAGDMATAQAAQYRAMDLVELLVRGGGPMLSVSKAIMGMIGVDCGPARLPATPASAKHIRALHEGLERIGFEEFACR